jgi:hypothetical protein
MKYYLHDSNSFNDEKITELYLEFGYEGLGLFYTILEKLALQEKPIKTKVLKHQLNISKKLEKIWSFIEEIDLISTNNGETFNKQLLSFSKKYQVSKEKNAKRISEWRDNQAVSENVTRSEQDRNDDKVKENKVNKIKESKESKDFIYSLDNFRNELFKKWVKYKKEKKSSYTQSGINQLLLDWQDKSNEELEKAINNSISNNYQGLFESKQQFNNGNTNNESKLGTSAARMEALRKW